jgi:hypothetical protein
VDNKQRQQSLLIFGLNPKTAETDVRAVLPTEIRSNIDKIYPLGKPTKRGARVPISVLFIRVSTCEKALELVRSEKFRRENPRISGAANVSELSRTGESRLKAVSTALRAKFDGIDIKKTFARFRNEKFTSVDFTLPVLTIGGVDFNVDEEVRRNSDMEANPTVQVRAAGRVVIGVRERRDIVRERRPDNRVTREQPSTQQRGVKRASNEARFTNAPPPMDGTSKGGVKYFRGGNKDYGNKGPGIVMSAVSDDRVTDPNSLFRNDNVVIGRKLPTLKWNRLAKN